MLRNLVRYGNTYTFKIYAYYVGVVTLLLSEYNYIVSRTRQLFIKYPGIYNYGVCRLMLSYGINTFRKGVILCYVIHIIGIRKALTVLPSLRNVPLHGV